VGRYVDHEVRADQTLLYKEDRVADNIIYYGRTEGFATADDEPLWQIKRVTIDGSIKTTTFGNDGKYNCQWDLRTTYFGAEPAPTNDPDLEVLVDLYPGDPVFFDFYDDSTPGTEQTPISYNVPVGKLLYLHNFNFDTRQQALARVLVSNQEVASCRTGSAQPSTGVKWTPGRAIPAGSLVEVKFEVILGLPVSKVGAYLQASLDDA
jgi:hypothetical protein